MGDEPVRGKGKFTNSRPVWFIYTGLGCQWMNMGKDLLNIEIFKRTFDQCAQALKPHNIDLYNVVTSDDPEVFDNVVNIYPAIAAIQVALTDVLFSLGIYPDGMAGHSMGEVGEY